MPYHTKPMDKKKPAKKQPPKKMTNQAKPKGLTDSQTAQLRKHAFKHSEKHISLMKRLMKNGMSFTKAHKEATKKVGS